MTMYNKDTIHDKLGVIIVHAYNWFIVKVLHRFGWPSEAEGDGNQGCAVLLMTFHV